MNIKTQQQIIFVGAMVVIVSAIFYLESRKVTPMVAGTLSDSVVGETLPGYAKREAEKSKLFEHAKEISTPDGFINVENFSISEFVGEKIVLVDFWTYSCINCQRTIPYLNSWYEKYADKGLVIVGVHTPEFAFEKEYANVQRAVEKFGVHYPVVLDNDYSTWIAYQNRYWPRKYLIDIDGFIVYDHIGEGAYKETEEKILELLNERNRILGEREIIIDKTKPEVDIVDFDKVRTPEIYLGAARIQYLANLPYTRCIMNSVCDFTYSEAVRSNTYELAGTWIIGEEEATLRSSTGSIFIHFSASKVNLVAGSKKGTPAQIFLDGELVRDNTAGMDVGDKGTVFIKEHDLYNLIDLNGVYGEHILEIRFLDTGVSTFAFTFG